MWGGAAEPGAFPADVGAANLVARGELFEEAKGRVKFDRKNPNGKSIELWGGRLLRRWARVGWVGRPILQGAAGS